MISSELQQPDAPLAILGFSAPSSSGGLFSYQQRALRKAFSVDHSLFFFNHATGTGKSIIAAAGIQELVKNKNEYDVALLFTIRLNKVNFARLLDKTTTDIEVCIADGPKKKRKELYSSSADVFVLNYEKANFDLPELLELAKDKRVLFILDEVQKVLRENKAQKGLKDLIAATEKPLLWPMSATVVQADAGRYWSLFDLASPNPLGSRRNFRSRYLESTKTYRVNGYRTITQDIWDQEKVEEIPQRVAYCTDVVRKTDPDVRPYFKNMEFIVESVQMSEQDRQLYDFIIDSSRNVYESLSMVERAQLLQTLRIICNTTEAVHYSDNQFAQALHASGNKFLSSTSAKYEMIIEKIKEIRDQGDKVVVFTHWTHLSLFPFSRMLDQNKIKHVQHFGTGMSAKEAQEAQDCFKKNKDVSVFLSSDAGSHGLNFQEARCVINIECPYDYDLLTQRNNRIDRADSHLDDLTSFVFITDDTVEERIWSENNKRRELAASVQGTEESLSRTSSLSDQQLRSFIFGEVADGKFI